VHDALAGLDMGSAIDLPQIAVVGSQSSGKSSVLEAVVGRDFLPRGNGIVTRCPLVLKLAQEPAGAAEWGEFEHKKGTRFDDFEMIRAEIEARTAEIAGPHSISSTPISLTVHSPRVLNLTLIDLPGIVTTALGDQPKDIERQIKEMVLTFIRPENTIILAVTPANADLANSVALKAARSVDPDFNRTIGVLTKLDLMDQGTNAVAILENRVLTLKRGWIGVVNRSQKAINENQSMGDAKEAERQYFLSSPEYRAMADQLGTDYLAHTMSAMLLEHIKRCMPALRARIDALVKKTRARQEALGMLEPDEDAASMLLKLLNGFGRDVELAVSGDATSGGPGTPLAVAAGATEEGAVEELRGGARLHYILYEAFGRHVQTLRAEPHLTPEKLRFVVRNSTGLQASFFPSNAAFLTLVREQIARLEDPALVCIQFVLEELRKICGGCADKLRRFPALHDRVVQITHDVLDELRVPCVHHIKTWVSAERCHINTHNRVLVELAARSMGSPAVVEAARAAAAAAAAASEALAAEPAADQRRPFTLPAHIAPDEALSPQEAATHAALRELVEAYFGVCKDTLCDQNPKVIAYLLVRKLEDTIAGELTKKLYKEDQFETLLAEAPHIAQARKATTRMMTRLVMAQAALDRVRDMPAGA
jgi:dynamin 1-like protein